MKVILKEDVFKLGSLGDEVEVKPGFARNYLMPQGKALPYTRTNVKQLKHLKNLLAKERADAIEKSKAIAEKLEEAEIEFTMKSGANGKLFGSVTQKHIFDALTEQGVELDRKKLHISVPIKVTGNHVIPVKLHSEVSANLSVKVKAEQNQEAVEEENVLDGEVKAEESSSEEVKPVETGEVKEVQEEQDSK